MITDKKEVDTSKSESSHEMRHSITLPKELIVFVVIAIAGISLAILISWYLRGRLTTEIHQAPMHEPQAILHEPNEPKHESLDYVSTTVPVQEPKPISKTSSRPCPTSAPSSSDIEINSCVEYQTMDGFGSTARLFEDSHVFNNMVPDSDGRAATVVPLSEQEKILDLLYTDLGLTRVRVQQEGAIEAPNDNNNPDNTDLSKFNFQFRRVDSLAEHVKRVQERGVVTYFFSPLFPESWMPMSGVEEYVEWAMAIVERYRSLGLPMPYYSIFNEPGLLTDTGRMNLSGAFIRDAVKLLGSKLKAEGFDTKIVISDDVNPCEAYKRIDVVLKDQEARAYIGALAYHLYDQESCTLAIDGTRRNSQEVKRLIKELGERYSIPVWMTEFFVPDAFQWVNIVHDLIVDYGASAVDYMWGFFGDWDNVRSSISSLVSLKNSDSSYLGYKIQKHYYTMGQFSRHVSQGAIRVDAQSKKKGLRVTAFKDAANRKFVVVTINNNLSDTSVTFKLSNANVERFSTVYRTSQTENWASLPSVSKSNSVFTTTLKGKSVTTFVGDL